MTDAIIYYCVYLFIILLHFRLSGRTFHRRNARSKSIHVFTRRFQNVAEKGLMFQFLRLMPTYIPASCLDAVKQPWELNAVLQFDCIGAIGCMCFTVYNTSQCVIRKKVSTNKGIFWNATQRVVKYHLSDLLKFHSPAIDEDLKSLYTQKRKILFDESSTNFGLLCDYINIILKLEVRRLPEYKVIQQYWQNT